MNTTAANKSWFSTLTNTVQGVAAAAKSAPASHAADAKQAASQAADRVSLSREAQEDDHGPFAALGGLMAAFGGEPDTEPSAKSGVAQLREALLGSSNGSSRSGEIKANMTFSGKGPSQLREQQELIEKIYKEVSQKRMGMERGERTCLYYATDIYKALMMEKKNGRLPDFQPRVYGWERQRKESQFGEAGARQGRTESTNFAHNLVVIENSKGKPTMALDPWQTGSGWSDESNVYHSLESYRAQREGGIGGLSGTLKAWPKGDELELLTGKKDGVGRQH